jgi:enoyl-CoA hydratase/carnithine racemase
MTFDPATFAPTHFLWEFRDCVGTVALNRPERKNPLTFDSFDELRDTFWQLKHTRAVKSVVLQGTGGNFCCGGDNEDVTGPLTRMDEPALRRFTQMTGDLVRAMRSCPQPVIAAVEGACSGAGAVIAAACDIRFAEPGATTAFLFNRIGLSGADMGACAILPRLIGQGRAAELLLTGREMTAEEGLAWGFYNRLTADPLTAAWALAAELAKGPSIALAITKRQLEAEWNASLDEALEMEARAQAHCMQTGDFKRACQARASDQEPVFQGN